MASKQEATLLLKIKTTGGKAFTTIGDRLKNLVSNARGVVLGIVAIGTAVGKLAIEASKFKDVETAFENLTKSVGEDSEKFLKDIKASTAGTISDLELMQKTNLAIMLGLPIKRFQDMLKIARSASKATGLSMDFMLNSIVTGLGRGSKLMLDNLGILFKLEEAYADYAETLGKGASELTETEQKQAFVNKALEVGLTNAEKTGKITVSLNDKWQAFKATLQNTANVLGLEMLSAFDTVGKDIDTVKKILIPATKEVGNYGTAWKTGNKELDTAREKLNKMREKTSALSKSIKDAKDNQTTFFGLFKTGKGVSKFQEDQLETMKKTNLEQVALIEKLEAEEVVRGTSDTTRQTRTTSTNEQIVKEEAARKKALEDQDKLDIKMTAAYTARSTALTEHEKELEIARQTKLTKEKENAEAIAKQEYDSRVDWGNKTTTFLSGGFKGLSESLVTTAAEILAPGYGKAAGEIFAFLTQGTEDFEKALTDLFSAEFLDALIANIPVLVEKVPELVENLIFSILKNLPELAIALAKAFGRPEFYVGLVKGIVKGLRDGIGAIIQDIRREIIDALSISGSGSKTKKAKGWIKEKTGINIPFLASGGIVRATPGGTPAIIGEAGEDEIVAPLSKLSSLMGGMGGNVINITVNGGLLGDESSARDMAVAIDNELLKLRQNNESVAFDQGVI